MDGMPGGVSDEDDALREDLAYLRGNDGAKTLGAFLRAKHDADLARLLEAKKVFFNVDTTKVRKHECIAVCAKELLDFDQRLGHIVLLRTERALPLFDAAILAEVRALEPGAGESDCDGASDDDREWSQIVHARIVSLPALLQRPKVSDVLADDVGSFLAVSGTVIRVGTTRVRDRQRTFVCRNKQCGHRFVVEAHIDMGGVISGNTNTHIVDCQLVDNHRQGMSIGSAKNLLVERTLFANTSGTAPEVRFGFKFFSLHSL